MKNVSIQIRRGYSVGNSNSYGLAAVIEHPEGEEPCAIPIRECKGRRILYRSPRPMFAGRMVSSELADEVAHLREQYPDAPEFGRS